MDTAIEVLVFLLRAAVGIGGLIMLIDYFRKK